MWMEKLEEIRKGQGETIVVMGVGIEEEIRGKDKERRGLVMALPLGMEEEPRS